MTVLREGDWFARWAPPQTIEPAKKSWGATVLHAGKRIGIPMSMRETTHRLLPPPTPNREEFPYVATLIFQGIEIFIENKAGSTRSGVASDGTRWSTKMKYHYGELARTMGADGDPVDVYIGPNPIAPTAFVIHQRAGWGADGDAPPGTYDEDKVMLGFSTREAAIVAYNAHYDRDGLVPGVTEIDVEDLYWMIEEDELCYGAPLVKARRGTRNTDWHDAPKSKYDQRRWRPGPGKAGGRWEYRDLPKDAPTVAAEPPKKKRRREYMADPTRTWEDIQPGELIQVGGRRGEYRYTPDAGEPGGPGLVWVTSIRTEAPELVRRDTMVPIKLKPKEAPPPPPRPPRKPKKAPGKGRVQIGDWEGRVRSGPVVGETSGEASKKARRTPAWERSKAKSPYLKKIEQGGYMMRRVTNPRTGKAVWAVHVPDEEKDALLLEMHKAIAGTYGGERVAGVKNLVRKMMQRYRLSGLGLAAQEELIAAAHLGIWKALVTYQGARPFRPHAFGYAMAEVMASARQMYGVGTSIPTRMMRNIHGYLAAKNRARGLLGKEPTPEQIARHWSLKKRDVFRSGRSLGNYVTRQEREKEVTDDEGWTRKETVSVLVTVDQSAEAVPNGEWRVKDPTGKEIGKTYPGKLDLIPVYEEVIQGGDAEDGDWMVEHEGSLVPGTAAGDMGLGSELYFSAEIREILDQMDDKHRRVIEMLIENGGMQGAGGELTYQEIIDELGIKGAKNTKYQRAREVVDRARLMFRRLSGEGGYSVGDTSGGWFEAPPPRPPREPIDPKTLRPSYAQLFDRFGSDHAVRVYHAAVRAGFGDQAAKILDKMKAGKAKEADVRKLYEVYTQQSDADRARAAREQTRSRVVDVKGRGEDRTRTAEDEMEEAQSEPSRPPGEGSSAQSDYRPGAEPTRGRETVLPDWFNVDLPAFAEGTVERVPEWEGVVDADGKPVYDEYTVRLPTGEKDEEGNPITKKEVRKRQRQRLKRVTLAWTGGEHVIKVDGRTFEIAEARLHSQYNRLYADLADAKEAEYRTYGEQGRDSMIIKIKRGSDA